MSRIEEIEQAVEQPSSGFTIKLAVWVDQRRQRLEIASSATKPGLTIFVRDHSAFLNSYSPQDEGLYDDVAAG